MTQFIGRDHYLALCKHLHCKLPGDLLAWKTKVSSQWTKIDDFVLKNNAIKIRKIGARAGAIKLNPL